MSQTLVSLAAVPWNFPLVGRTRMLTEAWRRAGQPTVFVQVPSLRTALQRLSGARRGDDGVRVIRPWPALPSRLWTHVEGRALERSIRRRAAALRRELDRCLDWSDAVALVVSPVWTPWLAELPFARVIYDCIDDLSVQTPRPELRALYRRWEAGLIDRADGAVASAAVLRDAILARRSDLPVALIRNGVDVERFERLARGVPRPADLPPAARPIVGFVGALYDWIDWELIRGVAAAGGELEFVFVGPTDPRRPAPIPAGLPNVRFLGPRPYARVPAYVAAFDACWVPFREGAVSAAANPVKVYEYLALGKPVVSTPIADAESFEGHVRIGRGADDVLSLLRRALSEGGAGAAERVAFARRNSWDARAAAYVDFAESLAGAPRGAALAQEAPA